MATESEASTTPATVHEQWKALSESNSLTGLDFRTYWRDMVPSLFSPKRNALVPPYDEETVKATLYDPLERFIFDGRLAVDILEQLRETESPPTLCGRVFKMGEPTYSCRDCGMDPTCVLCVDCFKMSPHRNHRYKMSTSCGGGYCDCGDLEAWRCSPFCERHILASTAEEQPSPIDRLPSGMVTRARAVFEHVLEYCHQMLCWEDPVTLPVGLATETSANGGGTGTTEVLVTYATMLFNDEIHTYEQVIRTLSRAISCSQKEAIDFATTVDREGRAIVMCSSFAGCKEVKGFVERITSQHGPKPLRVVVMDPRVVAHQNFALRLLAWFQQLIGGSQAFRLLFNEVVSMAPRPSGEERSILEGVIRADASLWKSARSQWHQLFIGGLLMEAESKRTFSRIFTRNYPHLMKDFIEDDHEHSLSVTSLSVQIFTVPTLAHMLIAEENVLAIVLGTFCTECETKLNANSNLAFERNHANINFRRAQYVLFDLKYLLSAKPDVWDTTMRRNFHHGFTQLLKLLYWMQGMDATVRQVGQHMEFEPDWESAFNLYIKLSPVISLVLEWCGSDRVVLIKAYRATLMNLGALNGSALPRVVQEVADHSVTCIKYDVAVQPLSIHLPLSRLLAGLHLHLDKFGLTFDSPEFAVKDKPCPVLLMEYPLRTQVMVAQVHAGMWRRNGYSLLNQIYFYRNVRCRSEMYDRDVVMLQLGASLVESNEFVIHLLNKFGLMNWVREDYEMGFPKAEEDSVRQIVTLVEEFLGLLLVLVAERHVPGVGQVTEDDRISKEIIQQLCIEPMAHSHLSKALSEDANHETGLESVVNRVATFRKPHGTGKGIYEINPDCYAHYNPFYYHYSREEQSKAEEAQRKRKKLAQEIVCCPPPLPPCLCPGFSMLVYVLQCDVMLHVMRLVLERSLNLRARSYSDGQSLKILHLIGFALHEEQRCIESSNGNQAFQFVSRSSKENIFVLLEALSTGPPQRRDVHKDLLAWVINKFRAVHKMGIDANQRRSSVEDLMDFSEAVGDGRGDDKDDDDDDEKKLEKLEERKKRSEMAAARRDRIMAQMAAMQKNFIREHADLFQKNHEPVAGSLSGSSSLMDLSEVPASTTTSSDGPPVCLGVGQTSRQWIPNRHICILCQEEQLVTLGGRAMVLSALVQRSTVLSKARCAGRVRDTTTETPSLLNSLVASADLFCAPHTSTCGHVMHADCWQKFFDSVLAKERRRPARARHHLSFDVDKQEFLCPLCECLSNTVIPIVPALGTMLPELFDRKVDMSPDEWMTILRTVVQRAKEVKCIVKDDVHDDAFESAVDDRGELLIRRTEETPSLIQLCTLHELCSHLDSDKALKLTWLYPDDVGGDGSAGEGSADSTITTTAAAATAAPVAVSSSLNEMMSLYASATYSMGLGLNPFPEDDRVSLTAWYSCSYTIHAIENLLRDQGKPLFGELSSRQSDCLAALVRFATVCTHVTQPANLENQCHRLLLVLLMNHDSDDDGDKENMVVTDVDAFGLLVTLVLSLPYAVRTRDDYVARHGISRRLPHGDGRDAFALHLVYVLHVVQILLSGDFSAKDDLDTPMDEEEVDVDVDVGSAAVISELYALVRWIDPLKQEVNGQLLLRKVRRYSLPFLRCCALFFHYLTGVPAPDDLHVLSVKGDGSDDFDPLCRYLGLATDLRKFFGTGDGSSVLIDLVKSWVRNPAAKKPIVEYPLTVNQLVVLPADYSELINDASLFTCPNSDGDDSRTPTMCLVCGRMLCSQSYCCQTELDGVLVGACTNHAQECGAGVGIFLRVRECKVLLLAGKTKGCFVPPPYLDEYGETDQGLRRGNPLHLCHENYRKLQKLWLSHGIPEEIAHSLESNTHIVIVEWQHL